jgi:sulfate permease, SulP family
MSDAFERERLIQRQDEGTGSAEEDRDRSPFMDHSQHMINASMEDAKSEMTPRNELKQCWNEWIHGFVPPPVRWIPRYSWRYIPADLLAGVTVGVMAVPQGMAYASLAGVSPIIGLWTAFLSAWVYSTLGASKDLIVGPVAILSLLTGEFVKKYPNLDASRLASLLAFGSGLILITISLFRLGFIVRLMSRAVILGFTAAAAIVIFFAQLKSALGAPLPAINTIIDFFRAMIQFGSQTNGWTALISASGIVFLLALKFLARKWKWTRWIPGPLLVVLISTIISWSVQLSQKCHVSIVGALPTGWPQPLVPPGPGLPNDSAFITDSFQSMAIIALLGSVEHMSIGMTFAFKNGYGATFSGDGELWALGITQFVCSWFSGYAPTGSFTRTAVNAAAGSRSTISSFICGLVVMFAFLFLSPALFYLPQAALASIVIVGLLGLFEFGELKLIWKSSKIDFSLVCATFLSTLLLGVENGIMIGVGLQLLLFLYREANSLKRIVISEDVDRQTIWLRPTTSTISFLNSTDFVSWIEKLASRGSHSRIFLDFTNVRLVDSSAAVLLRQAVETAVSKPANSLTVDAPQFIIYGSCDQVIKVLEPVLHPLFAFQPPRQRYEGNECSLVDMNAVA